MIVAPPDFRTRVGREQEVLAHVENDTAYPAWIDSIPQRRAAALRLVQRGVIELVEDRYVARFEFVRKHGSLWLRFVEWIKAWWV